VGQRSSDDVMKGRTPSLGGSRSRTLAGSVGSGSAECRRARVRARVRARLIARPH
jgi:hypothetical protein